MIILKGWPADPSQSIRLTAAMVSGAATRRVFLLVLLLAVSAMDLAEGEPQPRRRSKGSRCVSVTSHDCKCKMILRSSLTVIDHVTLSMMRGLTLSGRRSRSRRRRTTAISRLGDLEKERGKARHPNDPKDGVLSDNRSRTTYRFLCSVLPLQHCEVQQRALHQYKYKV